VYPFPSIVNCPTPEALGVISSLPPIAVVPNNLVVPTTCNLFAGLVVPIPIVPSVFR